MSLDGLPSAVRVWLSLHGQRGPDIEAARLALLADNVTLSFAGNVTEGPNAVIAHFARMGGPPSASSQQAKAEGLAAPGPEQKGGPPSADVVGGRGTRPSMPKPDWAPLPGSTATHVEVRGTFESSPGGSSGPHGLKAIDMVFTLNEGGKIKHLQPRPIHHEPIDLATPLAIGSIAPDFVLPDVDGERRSLHTEGPPMPTAVIWTCNHCPWALAWHDRLQMVVRDYKSKARVLQINSNDPEISPHDSLELCRKRVAQGKFAGEYLIDERQVVARQWGARHTPEVFVLDIEGRLVYHGAADADHRDSSLNACWLRDALDAALAAQPPIVVETPPIGCTIKWTFQSEDRLGMVNEAKGPILRTPKQSRIELLYWPPCPSHTPMYTWLQRLLPEYGLDVNDIIMHEIVSQQEADAERFVGSPTIRVDGLDILPTEGEAPSLTCRVYRHRNGRFDPLPDEQDLRDALSAART